MQIVLISPDFTQANIAKGDDIRDAIEEFWSSVWQQGYDADGRILHKYGDWTVYERVADGSLIPQGSLKTLAADQFKGRITL